MFEEMAVSGAIRVGYFLGDVVGNRIGGVGAGGFGVFGELRGLNLSTDLFM